MKSILINANNEKDIKLLLYLPEKMGMDEEDLEDGGLLKAMLEGRKGDFVSEEEVKHSNT